MLIKTESELKELISTAMREPAVGIDTEFVWERTFYPCLGLVQLGIKHDCYLIDPVAIEDLTALGELIADASVTKILHDAQQDLSILKKATGASPKNIFDTRLAYGFCSPTSILSLSALLEETIGVVLPKTETRANWLMRPLTDKMYEYACDDVKYLTELMDFINKKAEMQNTDPWLREEMKKYDSSSLYNEVKPNEFFRKIKGSDKLKGKKLTVLRELTAWREKTARRKNRPRGHIIHNNVLLDLSYKCPLELDQLKKIERLSDKAVEMYGTSLIKCIKTALNISRELQASPVPRLINKKPAAMIFGHIERKAASINIDPALICSRKELTMLLDSKGSPEYKKSRIFKGWRREFMQDLYREPDLANLLL